MRSGARMKSSRMDLTLAGSEVGWLPLGWRLLAADWRRHLIFFSTTDFQNLRLQ